MVGPFAGGAVEAVPAAPPAVGGLRADPIGVSETGVEFRGDGTDENFRIGYVRIPHRLPRGQRVYKPREILPGIVRQMRAVFGEPFTVVGTVCIKRYRLLPYVRNA